MDVQTLVILLLVLVIALILAVLWLGVSLSKFADKSDPRLSDFAQEARHRAMLTDLADGLAKQGERIASSQNEASERLRQSLSTLQLEQSKNLAGNREELIKQLAHLNLELQQRQDALKTAMLGGTLEKLSEQGLAQQHSIEATMRLVTGQITATIDGLTKSTDARLSEIGGKVNERLD